MKEKLNLFKEKYPILLSVIIAALWYLLFNISGIIFAQIPSVLEGGNGYLIQLLVDLAMTVFGIGLMFLFGYKKIFKERKYSIGKEIVTGLYLIIISVLAIFSHINLYIMSNKSDIFIEVMQKFGLSTSYSTQPFGQILLFIVTMILVGTAEEFTFRGLLANLIFDKYGKTLKGVWFSTFMTGIIFGSMHIFNAMSPGISLHSTTIQAILATVVGMVFTAIYFRTRNIWFIVFLHAFNNFAGLFASGVLGAGTISTTISSYSFINLIGAIPHIIVLLVLLRKSKMEEILGIEEV